MPLTIEMPMTTASAVSSARILRPARPLRATPIIVRSLPRASRGSRARVDGPRSRTMSPSARNRTRSAIAAACASWVTMTVVWPSVSTESRSSSRISPLVVESRLPVGSSANITRRPRDEGAGDGDALLLAAGELGRAVREAVVRPTLATTSSSHAWSGLLPGELERQHDVLGRREHREQVEELEDEADVVAAQLRQLGVVEAADVDAGDGDLAGGRLVEAGEDVHQRRLARSPTGP